MRHLLWILLLLSNLLQAENNSTPEYLGSSYNLNLAFEPSCLHFIGTTDIKNEHIGPLAKIGFCDEYTDNTQSYLKESLYLGLGLALYSHSIYRDSFILSFSANIERAWVMDVTKDITADSYSVMGIAGMGYQWHFQRGYIFSLMAYYSYRRPFMYKDAGDADLAHEISADENKFLPTFLIGWRF